MNIGDNGNLRRNIRLYTEVFLRFINDTVPKNYASAKVALFCIYFCKKYTCTYGNEYFR